jgi:DNA-binding transcriptional ArsR family regulator
MTTLTRAFKALSDDKRVQMLGLLLKYTELCVCDFEKILKTSQSQASRHLQVLQRAGLITGRRQATWLYYRRTETPESMVALLKVLRPVIKGAFPKYLDKDAKQWLAKKAKDVCKPGTPSGRQ